MNKGLKVPPGESFENLEQIPKQVGTQLKRLPIDIGKTAIGQITGKQPNIEPVADTGEKGLPAGRQVDPLTGIEIPSKQRIRQLKKQEKKAKKAAIPYAQQIIQGVHPQAGGQQNIPTYISGKPGFNQEQATKQILGEELPKKRELPPPVSASKHKMGTSERRGPIGG